MFDMCHTMWCTQVQNSASSLCGVMSGGSPVYAVCAATLSGVRRCGIAHLGSKTECVKDM